MVGVVASTHNLTATLKNNVNESCAPTRSAAVCADLLVPLAWRATRLAHGLKKAATLPDLAETLVVPDASDRQAMVLELDELWSFVCKKSNKRWIWIALCRATRQVVAYVIGDRSQASCQQLWQRIPAAYRAGHCYSDFWEAYQAVIPEEQHTAAGKETGLTAHVERWNNTLRQRLGRFVRKTLSFSKSDRMHEICLRLFLHDYNQSLALSSA